MLMAVRPEPPATRTVADRRPGPVHLRLAQRQRRQPVDAHHVRVWRPRPLRAPRRGLPVHPIHPRCGTRHHLAGYARTGHGTALGTAEHVRTHVLPTPAPMSFPRPLPCPSRARSHVLPAPAPMSFPRPLPCPLPVLHVRSASLIFFAGLACDACRSTPECAAHVDAQRLWPPDLPAAALRPARGGPVHRPRDSAVCCGYRGPGEQAHTR